MRNPTWLPRRLAVAYHPDLPAAAAEAQVVAEMLRGCDIDDLLLGSLYDETLRTRIQAHEFDVLIALGGDGTMLRAGRLCAPGHLPVLGINLGHFGFLIELQRGEWRDHIPELLAGHFWMEDRMMIHAELWREGVCQATWEAINDIVITRGKYVRPIQLNLDVHNYHLTHYTADGLIVSTATGSTAYAMAVGGPVMPPELRNIMVIPVAPHLSMDRAIILSEGECISIKVQTQHEAVVSVDGSSPVEVYPSDEVRVCSSSDAVTFIRFQDPGYFYRNLAKYMQRNPTTGGMHD